jgi:hypothetical protein
MDQVCDHPGVEDAQRQSAGIVYARRPRTVTGFGDKAVRIAAAGAA